MEHYDVIVIGTGAGGGTLVAQLAPSGKRILLLERGDWLPREPENWLAQDVFVDNRYLSPDTWYDEHDRPFQPQVHYFVGGATKLYGAALYRLRKEDFGELRHRDGISPAWPIEYDELEPYYTRAERLYHVHGARGEDPTEPPASAPYPYPPVSHEPRIQQLADDLAAAGLHPFHAPCGIMLREDDMAYSRCVRCPDCDGFPCLVHAKSDAEVLAVRPALEHPNVTLLRTPRRWRWRPTPGARRSPASCASATARARPSPPTSWSSPAARPTPRSCCWPRRPTATPTAWPTAPDEVGRNYVFHNSVAVLALSKEQNPTRFQKTLGLNDFYFGSPDTDYPLGNIQMVGKSQAPMFHGEKPRQTALAPSSTLKDIARHAVDFWLSTEDLPRPENRVTLRADGSIRINYTPTNEVPKQQLYGQFKSMLGRLGMHSGHLPAPTPVPQERHPGRRRRAPGRHRAASAPTRRRPCSTSTARRTSSTTSTSSTRASSRASAR